MNIAVFIKRTTLHDGFGGLETQNKALCEGLAKKGHRITVFSPKHNLDKEEVVENNVTYVFVASTFRSLAGFGSYDKNNWLNRSVEAFTTKNTQEKFDIALSQSSAGLGIIRKKNELNIKVISICHGSTLGELKTSLQSLSSIKDFITLIPKLGYYALSYFSRQREFVLHADFVVAVSQYVKKSIMEETFILEDKIQVIYNGLDLVPQNGANSKQEIIIVYAGLIHWSKGLKELLFAVKGLESLNFKVVILGDGPHLTELRNEISSLHLSSKVTTLGKVLNTEAIQQICSASIFVLPSKRVEGFPVSLVEAMFCSLPIVASDIGGISESVRHNFSGILCKPGDVTELKDSLERLITNNADRVNMGKNGLQIASSEFTLDVMLNKYEQIMEKVLL